LPKRKIAAEHCNADLRESSPKRYQQRLLAVAASSMREHKPIAVRVTGAMKEAPDGLVTREIDEWFCCYGHISRRAYGGREIATPLSVSFSPTLS
jgi:hypothetical protein